MRRPTTARRHSSGPSAIDRIIHIHSRLAEGAHVTATSLAEEMEVSPRTVKRDIEALRHKHGAEIRWEPATGTYFCEKPGEHLPLLRISADEAIAVALAGKTFAAWGGSPLGRALESALAKIADVVGNAVSLPADTITDCIFQPAVANDDDATRHHFARLLEAIRRRLTLHLAYRKPGTTVPEDRQVNPLHLAYLDHEWMLVAFDHTRDELRNFLLSRIAEIHHTGRGFLPPEGFDPKRHLAGAFGRYVGGPLQEVALRFDTYAAPFIRERRWHPSQTLRDLPDGSVEVSLRVNHLLDVQRWVLSWGAHAEALAPDALRTAITHEVAALAVRYKAAP